MEKSNKLLNDMREAKRERGLSYQDIADITEQNGEAVSVSTVKRVLNSESEIDDFRFNSSVLPVARAILGDDECLEGVAQGHDAVETVMQLKDEQIMIYQRQLARLSKLERVYRIGFIVVVCILAVLFGADIALGNFGWIRY